MEPTMEVKTLQPGDIVQANGEGRAMIVADPADYPDAWCTDMPEMIICEWMNDGYKHDAVHHAKDLEVVGSKLRHSREQVYEWLTERTIATVTAMAVEGRREMALGALQLWSNITGKHALDADRLRMQQLIDRLPPP